LTTASQSLY